MASHHPTIDPILPELRTALADLAPRQPEDPASSPPPTTTPAARRRSMPTTGWPTCAIRCGSARPSPAAAADHRTFIEISPHPLLTHAITETLESAAPGRRARVSSAMNRDETRRCPSTAGWPRSAADRAAPPKGASSTSRTTPWQHSSRTGWRIDPAWVNCRCSPVARRAHGIAVRPRPRLAGRRRNRRVPVAGRPQGARPTHHARRGIRRDRAGRRQRSARSSRPRPWR